VTTGIKYIDYFLIGSVIHEKEDDAEIEYSEKTLKIEGSGLCFDGHLRFTEIKKKISKEQLGISDNITVFISGANFYKIIPELRIIWAEIISKVPESKLILYPFGPAWSNSYPKEEFNRAFEKILSKYNITPKRLLMLDSLSSREDIISLLRCGDIYLDAFPYSGAASLLDPLAVGVPPVVMGGDRLRFSQGAAILKELGVPELVVENETEYIQRAVSLATDEVLRNQLKDSINAKMKMNPRFLDTKAYAKEIGRALKDMVRSVPQTGSANLHISHLSAQS